MFKKLTGNIITFISTVIYYVIREYRSGSKAIDKFYSSIISGLYIVAKIYWIGH